MGFSFYCQLCINTNNLVILVWKEKPENLEKGFHCETEQTLSFCSTLRRQPLQSKNTTTVTNTHTHTQKHTLHANTQLFTVQIGGSAVSSWRSIPSSHPGQLPNTFSLSLQLTILPGSCCSALWDVRSNLFNRTCVRVRVCVCPQY